MKKQLSLLLVLVLTFALVTTPAYAKDETWNYQVDYSMVENEALLYWFIMKSGGNSIYFAPGEMKNGIRFCLEDNIDSRIETDYSCFIFPSFISVSVRAGGQFELVCNGNEGDCGYISYFKDGTLYKMSVFVKSGPNNGAPSNAGTSSSNNTLQYPYVHAKNYEPNPTDIKKTTQLYWLASTKALSELVLSIGSSDSGFRFGTGKTEESMLTGKTEYFSFPFFMEATVLDDSHFSFKLIDAKYGYRGEIKYFDKETGTLYKLNVEVNAPMEYTKGMDAATKLALKAKGAAESKAKASELESANSTKTASCADDFSDVLKTEYFYDSVDWALKKGITTGTSNTTFGPNANCTRGQVVTFLWRLAGEPTVSQMSNFSDVASTDYYAKAISWAVDKGITNGTSDTTFSPNLPCSNASILTFLYRSLGEPGKTTDGEWYQNALNWAENSGIISGTFVGDYNIQANCPRANVVEYMYRYSK